MTPMKDPSGRITTWGYDTSSRLTSISHSNGTESRFAYDSRGQLASVIDVDAVDSTLFSESYTRNATGRITQVDRNDGSVVIYDYDVLNRLTLESFTPAGGVAEVTTYQHDAVGNRVSVTDASGTRTFDTNANGQLLDDGVFSYSYDDNGNVVERINGSETLTFAYDAFARLMRVNHTGGTGPSEIIYRYDPPVLSHDNRWLHLRLQGGPTWELVTVQFWWS